MQPLIRGYAERDAEAVVDLSLRAWAPVFASLERVLGCAIFRRLHPDWREDQRRAVQEVCAAKKGRVWVAEVDGAALTIFALDRLKEAGMTVAMVETGGDPGHAAARRTYEKAGCVQLPVARYFKNL